MAQEKNEASADQSEDVRLTVDDLLSKCPSAAEIQGIDAALDLSFESDPTKEQRVCTVGATASNLSRLQTRTYQTLLIMRNLKFSHPLPWTDQSLYDWFIGNIHGIRFRDDIDANFCCEPTGIINVQARKYQARAAVLTDRWLDPRSGTGAESLLLLLVHEARHAQAGPHRCEDTSDVLIRYKDTDVAELGAWGVQYQLLRWLVEYSNPRFLEAPGADPAYYLLEMGRQADSARKQFFCD